MKTIIGTISFNIDDMVPTGVKDTLKRLIFKLTFLPFFCNLTYFYNSNQN